jgi:hypothetical protein
MNRLSLIAEKLEVEYILAVGQDSSKGSQINGGSNPHFSQTTKSARQNQIVINIFVV